ncbi:hypothetical protein, partial [Arthrobacter pigmenti]
MNTTDWGDCATGTGASAPASGSGAGSSDPAPGPGISGANNQNDIASQQTITLVGGMQQNPCGMQAASLLFTTSQDFGTCGGEGDVSGNDGESEKASYQGHASDVASQQTITLVGGMQQNPCGMQAASLLFVTSQDFGTCATGGNDGDTGDNNDGGTGNGDAGDGQVGVSISDVSVNG